MWRVGLLKKSLFDLKLFFLISNNNFKVNEISYQEIRYIILNILLDRGFEILISHDRYFLRSCFVS